MINCFIEKIAICFIKTLLFFFFKCKTFNNTDASNTFMQITLHIRKSL